MLDEKKLEKITKRVERFLKEGIIRTKQEKRHVKFFLANSKNSLESANLLFSVSTKPNLKKVTGFPDFNGFLWVINSSYYSMFYAARALLENRGIKIKTDFSIHAITFDALVFYYYISGKLQKRMIEDFIEAEIEAKELLGKEKAQELIESYFYEKKKRADYTYELGLFAMQNKAKTSLDRAKRFNEEIRKMIEV